METNSCESNWAAVECLWVSWSDRASSIGDWFTHETWAFFCWQNRSSCCRLCWCCINVCARERANEFRGNQSTLNGTSCRLQISVNRFFLAPRNLFCSLFFTAVSPKLCHKQLKRARPMSNEAGLDRAVISWMVAKKLRRRFVQKMKSGIFRADDGYAKQSRARYILINFRASTILLFFMRQLLYRSWLTFLEALRWSRERKASTEDKRRRAAADEAHQ